MGLRAIPDEEGLSAYGEIGPRKATFDQLAYSFSLEKNGRDLEALVQAHRQAEPEDKDLIFWETEVLWLRGEYEAVLKQLAEHKELFATDTVERRHGINWEDRRIRGLVRLKRLDEALAAAEAIEVRRDPIHLLIVHAARGDLLKTAEELELYVGGDGFIHGYVLADPDLGPALKSDRFRELRDRYPEPEPEEPAPSAAESPKKPEPPAKPEVEPKSVRKLVADGRHNAFTALARWRDEYWLAFRSGTDHNSADGDIVVMRSADAEKWTEAFRLNVLPDDRDPQFLVTPKRLFLYDQAMKGRELTCFVTYTDDGKTWSKPEPVYEPRFILWKPCTHEGRHYAAAHKKDETSGGRGREVHLVVSEDGLAWRKISTIREGNWESETTLLFGSKGHLTAFLRQKYGSPTCEILEADPPYTEWKPRPAGVTHLSGHSAHTFRGVTYLISRTMEYPTRKSGTMIYTYPDGKLHPYCELPSGGDCAYAEAVQVGEEMLVSYYSSHEKGTNIYLARVPLKR